MNSEFEAGGRRGSVSRIDPTTNEVFSTIEVGHVPPEAASGDGSVWVSNSADDTVSRIDPRAESVVATIDVCAAPEGLAAGDGAVWVACEDDAQVGRIDPCNPTYTGGIGTDPGAFQVQMQLDSSGPLGPVEISEGTR